MTQAQARPVGALLLPLLRPLWSILCRQSALAPRQNVSPLTSWPRSAAIALGSVLTACSADREKARGLCCWLHSYIRRDRNNPFGECVRGCVCARCVQDFRELQLHSSFGYCACALQRPWRDLSFGRPGIHASFFFFASGRKAERNFENPPQSPSRVERQSSSLFLCVGS